jgi:Fur family ferric uptake transcriptional regulator
LNTKLQTFLLDIDRPDDILLRTGRNKEHAMKRPTHESLVNRMREMGFRVTGQRKVLASLLENSSNHLDADTLLQKAQRIDPSIHRATVYRTLSTLKKAGLLDELDLMHVEGGQHYYEVRPSVSHIHLVCVSCGKVEEPEGRFLENLKKRLEKGTGFRVEVARLELGGQCSACRRLSLS